MNRRNFVKLAGATAVAAHAPSRCLPQDLAPDSDTGLDYARFCAKPENARQFSVLSSGRIVRGKLDPSAWKPALEELLGNVPELRDSWDGVPMQAPVPGLQGSGPYAPTWESMLQYEAPKWYRDAKFGIWAHWSPQCVPEAGDWYARKMYEEGSDLYKYHLEHYGHPSSFGYKDLCAQWTLLNWQPEELMERYQKAGARFFVALANHHDGFDCWNSMHHSWNAVKMGPHRDVVGAWSKAAKDHGMRFGVSVHGGYNWWFAQASHGADKLGPMAGVPYDGADTLAEGRHSWWRGNDPQQLYGPKHPPYALPAPSYVKDFYDRTRDLIDQHDPDLLYFDSLLFPVGWGGMNLGAYFYNNNLQKRGGKMEGVVNVKEVPEKWTKAVVADSEGGLSAGIQPYAWQSEVCIGGWHYDRKLYETPGQFGGYMHPRLVIHWLVDVVSKNGTFVLNIPGKPDGTIDTKEIAVLDKITVWMQTNSEAIYETRPWKAFGEGPNNITPGRFHGMDSLSKLGSSDVRFTYKAGERVLFAIILGTPGAPLTIQTLGLDHQHSPGKIFRVEVLGVSHPPMWKQNGQGLTVELPKDLPETAEYGSALKIYLT